MICSNVGSNTYPAAFAFAKQIGHFRLHRFVRSRLQSPHSYGQTFASTIEGFSRPTPSKAQFSALRYISASDQHTSSNSPCSLHVFFIFSAPSPMYNVAGMTFKHSGQRLPVRRGSPFWSFEGIVTIVPAERASMYMFRTAPVA